jgi:hypothetical protein
MFIYLFYYLYNCYMDDIMYNPSLYILAITGISLSIKIVYILRFNRYPRSFVLSSCTCPSCSCAIDFPKQKENPQQIPV